MSQRPDAAARLAAIVDSSDDAIIGLDLDGAITSWNPAAESLYGYTAAEAVGQPIRLIVPPELIGAEEEVLARVAKGEVVLHFETMRRHRNGSLMPISLTVSPIRAASGEIIGASKIARDISGRQHADREARRLAAIVESSDDAIISKDLDGIVKSWNGAASRMFGYSADEMIGRSIRTLIPSDRQAEEDDVLAHIRRGEKVEHFETIRRCKDGTLVPISLTVSPIRGRDGTVIGASKIARDISDRKRADAERTRLLALAQQQVATTRKLNQIGGTVASTLDRSQIVSAVTDGATDVTGAEFGAFFYNETDPTSGESYLLYTLSGAPKEAFEKFPHPRATAIFGPTFRGEGIIRLDDVTKDPRYGQNPPFHGMPKGHLPVCSYLAVPVKSRTGGVLGGLFFGHSAPGRFTQQHEELASGIAAWASMALENARLYGESQDVSRVKDEFLATLSHELRTPLNAILGYARMIRSGLVSGDKDGRAVETIERNATSLTQIVEDVLDVSRIVSEDPPERAAGRDPDGDTPRTRCRGTGSGCEGNPGRDGSRGSCRSCLGRPGPASAGDLEPGLQCRQVHRSRRHGARAARACGRAPRSRRQRYGNRNRRGLSSARVRAFPAGGFRIDARTRRSRAGPRDFTEHRRNARRDHPGGERGHGTRHDHSRRLAAHEAIQRPGFSRGSTPGSGGWRPAADTGPAGCSSACRRRRSRRAQDGPRNSRGGRRAGHDG